jgi:hypothetical protein
VFNFPSSPAIGDTFPNPAVALEPVYTWDGEKWGGAQLSAGPPPTVTLKPAGEIFGLTLTTPGGSATFSVAPGLAADSLNQSQVVLAALINKTTNPWVVGNNNGALDTGTAAINTWYHVFLIERADTNVVDVLVSLSATAPLLPSPYTLFRRIGAIRTDASVHWLPFIQVGDEFLWGTPVLDVNTATLGTTATLFTISVPGGVQVNARFRGNMTNATASALGLVNSPDEGSVAGTPIANQSSIVQISSAFISLGDCTVRTNVASQIRASASAAGSSLRIVTYGWIDRRGKNG